MQAVTGRVQQPGEPYWLPADRSKALAWQADQAEICSKCSQRKEECLDEEGATPWSSPREAAASPGSLIWLLLPLTYRWGAIVSLRIAWR